MRPPYPRQQGHRPCTQSATRKTERSNFFPHGAWGNGKRAHGRNENVEKSRSGKCELSCRFFLIFPGCRPPARRCFTPPSPWAGASGASSSQRNNLPLQRGFCVAAVRAPNSQKCNLPLQRGFCVAAVPHPIRKNTFVRCKSMCACYFVSPEHCLQDTHCNIRYRVQGQ